MKRREFLIGLLAGLIVTGARAQQRVRISILHSGFPNRTPIHQLFEAIAGTTKIAVFWNPSFPGHADALENTRTSALARGIEVFSRELKGMEDLEPAFDDAIRAKVQAAIFMADNVMFGNRKRVAEVAINHRLPTIHSFPSEAEDGGLMFYGPSNGENYRRAAALAERILKGKRPSELPVERPTKFELIINLKTAKALELTI